MRRFSVEGGRLCCLRSNYKNDQVATYELSRQREMGGFCLAMGAKGAGVGGFKYKDPTFRRRERRYDGQAREDPRPKITFELESWKNSSFNTQNPRGQTERGGKIYRLLPLITSFYRVFEGMGGGMKAPNSKIQYPNKTYGLDFTRFTNPPRLVRPQSFGFRRIPSDSLAFVRFGNPPRHLGGYVGFVRIRSVARRDGRF
jgi:hypothetical protein